METIEYNGMYNFYSYMAWQLITDPSTLQYQLREDAGQNFDSEGFGVIEGRYVIACCERYGEIGDYINWTLANGNLLMTVIGEHKSSLDPNNNGWGHVDGNGLNVIEFVVDYDTWYYPMHDNPGTETCHPEWAGELQGYDKVGNYWTGGVDDFMGSVCAISGERYVNGSVRNVYFIGTVQSDGYIYFNDDVMWRCYSDGSNLQRFYFTKEIWVRSNDITNINIRNLSTAGGTSLPPGGAGVEAAVNWAIAIANDNSHGYDQPTRDSGVDFDCSSLVSWAFRENGFNIPSPSPATWTMVSAFTDAGFTWYPGMGNDSSELYRGDILLWEPQSNGHTAIYIGEGELVEALINEFGGISGGQAGDQTGNEIRITGFYSYPWGGILRYEG